MFASFKNFSFSSVLEQNPPKQGLKHGTRNCKSAVVRGFRAKSTKTRIETEIQKQANISKS